MEKLARAVTLCWAVPALFAVRLLMKLVRPFTSEEGKRTVDREMQKDITINWDGEQLDLFIDYVDRYDAEQDKDKQ